MTDEDREKYCLAMQQGMQAMNEQRMAERALQQQAGMMNTGLGYHGQADGLRNFWSASSNPSNAFIPEPAKPSLLQRLRDKLAKRRQKGTK